MCIYFSFFRVPIRFRKLELGPVKRLYVNVYDFFFFPIGKQICTDLLGRTVLKYLSILFPYS